VSGAGEIALRAAVGLLPVCCFLVALLALDSFKLVRLRMVALVIALGAASALLSYVVNVAMLRGLGLDLAIYARSVGPLFEEIAKGLVVIVLLRTHRIGFLVDAAILGFAVGTGFALVENLYFLQDLGHASMATWIVRGFGTALLHGGVQSIFAVMLLALSDRRGALDFGALLPALGVAWLLHAGFNQFVLPPVWQALAMLLVLPPVMIFVFARSEAALRGSLGTGFDADRDLLALLDSGGFQASPQGQYLEGLRGHFRGEVVGDLLCALRLHVELALRAKGLLMMREAGIEVPVDEDTRARFEELRYLEGVVGPTALRALNPLLQMSRRDLWQLYMLGK
jgi:RsiW-degrading membrane proteinase PrsW (M82 family)